MEDVLGAETALLITGMLILIGSIVLYFITGKPRLRFLLLLDFSLLFWIASYGLNLITNGAQMSGTWQIVSLMGMCLVLFSFIAAFVDYSRNNTR